MRNAELQGGSDPRGPPPCTTRARSIPHSAFRIPHSGFHVTIPNLVERAVDGRFGPYGGRYVPETLMAALEELERVYEAAKGDAEFWGRSEERRVGKEGRGRGARGEGKKKDRWTRVEVRRG